MTWYHRPSVHSVAILGAVLMLPPAYGRSREIRTGVVRDQPYQQARPGEALDKSLSSRSRSPSDNASKMGGVLRARRRATRMLNMEGED